MKQNKTTRGQGTSSGIIKNNKPLSSNYSPEKDGEEYQPQEKLRTLSELTPLNIMTAEETIKIYFHKPCGKRLHYDGEMGYSCEGNCETFSRYCFSLEDSEIEMKSFITLSQHEEIVRELQQKLICQYHKDLPLCACMDCVKDEVNQIIKIKDKQLEEKEKEILILKQIQIEEIKLKAILQQKLQSSIPKESIENLRNSLTSSFVGRVEEFRKRICKSPDECGKVEEINIPKFKKVGLYYCDNCNLINKMLKGDEK